MNTQLAMNNQLKLTLVTDGFVPSMISAESNVLPMAKGPLHLVSNWQDAESDDNSISCADGVCLLAWKPKKNVA